MDDQTPGAVKAPLEAPVRPHDVLVERLRGDAYALPSCGPWIERDGSTLPNNSCSQAADEIERLRAVLERIGAMDPATDSSEGYNEWGEADCFHQAQSAALMALGPNARVKAAAEGSPATEGSEP